MKIYDFDEKFFEFVRTWMAIHPGLTEKQIEASYNEMMLNWLNAPAKWLDGVAPGAYFDRYSDPKDFVKLLRAYDERSIGLPEPLYSRIVYIGQPCVPALIRMAMSDSESESLRSTAVALLRDIGGTSADEVYIDLVCADDQPVDLCEMACDILSTGDGACVEKLLERYEGASPAVQTRILDICVCFPGDGRIFDHCLYHLKNEPEKRALFASYLAKLGDARALDTLQPMLQSTDIGYLDYIEIRNAVETLGGEPGEDRAFYGDPDFEALRNI